MTRTTRSALVLTLSASVLAARCAATDAPPDVSFDGARAMEYARIQVDAGPRIPGTEVHRLVGDRIAQVMRENADTVIEQRWNHVTAAKVTLPLRNIFAQFNPAARERVLFISHWDTRPRADKSFAVDDQKKPVPGANDGASSTGLLLALAEALKAAPTTVGVDFLFTDGEDYGDFGPPQVDVLLGAKYFAEHPLPDSSYRPLFGVLWDMIGNTGVRVLRESYSEQHAREVNDRVWNMAASLGYSRTFVPEITTVTDDHYPLIDKGFRVADVIDLAGYQYHHTTQDTMDKLSVESFTIMGRVALALIRDLERR
jgi:glutaminyl-peptide cyclotransferase